LRPRRVIDAPPLRGEFVNIAETTGPSNVYPTVCVPTTAPTVVVNTLWSVASAPEWHLTLEELSHCVVTQLPSERDMVKLKSKSPKLSPVATNCAPPDEGAFKSAKDTIGASKEKTLPPQHCVPERAELTL
jgi:hypothetical protein